jgi:hypothetical protein
MKKRIEVETDSGLVVFRDTELPQPCPDGKIEEYRGALRAGAEDGSWFYLDAEDPVRYRIDVCVDEEPEGLPAHRFQPLGGTFRVNLESGRMAVSAFESWSSKIEPVEVPPGTVALTVRGPGEFDSEGYDREYRELLGDADWRYWNRVDKIGIAGCLSTLIAAVLLAIPFTRQYWYLAPAVLALGWGPHLLLRFSRTYREIEGRVKEHEDSLPHFVVQLTPIDPAAAITGGHLMVQ